MSRILTALSVVLVASCAAPPREAKVATPRSMTMHKPPPAAREESGAPIAAQVPLNVVVFTNLGYQVRIPRGWGYRTNVQPKGGDAFDLVLENEEHMTSMTLTSYWDSEKRKVTLDDLAYFHRFRFTREGNLVSDEAYDVDDKGYFVTFDVARYAVGRVMEFHVTCVRLHRFPEPAFTVVGIAPASQRAFMRASVAEVLAGIMPWKKDEE